MLFTVLVAANPTSTCERLTPSQASSTRTIGAQYLPALPGMKRMMFWYSKVRTAVRIDKLI